MTLKTKAEINQALGQILNFYESYRTALKLSPEEATLKVLETYDDFREWIRGKKSI